MIKKEFFLSIVLTFIITFEMLFYHLAMEIRIPLMLVILLLITILYTLQKPLLIPKTFTILFIFLILSYFFSSLFSGNKFLATIEIIKLICYFLLVILVISILREDKKIFFRQFVSVSFVTAFLALIGILEVTGRVTSQKNLPLIEPFHWPTLSASFFLLATPVTLVLFLREKRSFIKMILFIFIVLMSLAWILTKSYLIVFLVTMLTISFDYLYCQIKNKNFRQLKINARNIALLTLLLFVTLPNLFSSFGQRPISKETTLYLNRFFFQDKADIIGFSLQSIKSHFLTGIGPGNFAQFYKTHLTKSWTWSDFAGSEPLQVFVETGFLGFTAYLFLIIYIVIVTIKRLITSIKTEHMLETSISLTVILFLFLSSYNSSLRIFPIGIVFYFLLGYLLSSQESIKIKHKFILIPISILLMLSTVVLEDGVLLNLGQRFFVKEKYQLSQTIFHWLTERPKFLLNPKALVWNAALEMEKGRTDQALKYLNLVKQDSYSNLEIDYQIAQLHYNRGEVAKAEKILEENILSHPYSSPKYYLALAKIEAEKNKLALNLYWLKRASLIYPISFPKDSLSLTLYILDNLNYLSSLQNIYYYLYTNTHNKYYLEQFAELIY